MRPIDADALSSFLFKRMGEYETLTNDLPKHSYEGCVYYGKVTALYEAQLAIDRIIPTLDLAPKWISVKDRLPEEYQTVLAIDLNENFTVLTFYTDSYYGEKWSDDNEELINLNWITHWMPLPEPPKEG